MSEDGLTWDFTLKPGITFTDGTPLDAEAVVANIAHIQDPDTGSSTGYLALAKVSRAEAVDDLTVRMHLSEPDGALLESLSQQWVAIESPAGIERGQDLNCEAPIGTGPFVVAGWERQQSVTLERNPDYRSAPSNADNTGPARVDGIEWRFIPDAGTRQAALLSGEVDIMDNPLSADVAGAGANGLTAVQAPRPGSSNRIELNSSKSPLNDGRVRQAVILAADPGPGIDSLTFGTVQRSTSLLSSVEPAAVSEADRFVTDPTEAARLLDEAGWDETGDDGIRVRDGERLTLELPVSTNQSGPDVLRILYHSSGITPAPSGYFANHAQVDDPEIDDALERMSRATDASERTEPAAQAQRLVLAGWYVLPLYDQQNTYLVGPDLHGFEPFHTVSTPWLQGAWLDRACPVERVAAGCGRSRGGRWAARACSWRPSR